ncbi:methyltransferase [Candidatus Woesearchaeota archaeon]|nr:methyltransferase [Candidatus Woesearchaeota archaeon]
MPVYSPEEDTYMILDEVKKHASGKVLEIGTGSGIIAVAAAKNKDVESVTAVDIDREAIEAASGLAKREKVRIRFVHGDLFANIKGKFDTIIFNPPYLPQDEGIEDVAIYGGKKGYETIERFLASSRSHLAENGKILLLFSSLTKKERVDAMIADSCLEFQPLSEKPLFFERLYVYLIEKSALLKELENKGVQHLKRFAKGHRGIIYLGRLKGRKVAVKAERKHMGARCRVLNEVRWLERLNKKGIGPKLLFGSNDYFVYEFVEGRFIEDFIKESGRKKIVAAIKNLLHQCYLMDALKVNKEEMHHPVKHIIVSKGKPVMIDFERCRSTEKPKNVTQFLQFLSGGHLASLLLKKGINFDKNELRDMAKEYSLKRAGIKRLVDGIFHVF